MHLNNTHGNLCVLYTYREFLRNQITANEGQGIFTEVNNFESHCYASGLLKYAFHKKVTGCYQCIKATLYNTH